LRGEQRLQTGGKGLFGAQIVRNQTKGSAKEEKEVPSNEGINKLRKRDIWAILAGLDRGRKGLSLRWVKRGGVRLIGRVDKRHKTLGGGRSATL